MRYSERVGAVEFKTHKDREGFNREYRTGLWASKALAGIRDAKGAPNMTTIF